MNSSCFACGNALETQNRFCPQCGSPIAVNLRHPARLQTVATVAYSVPGYTALLETEWKAQQHPTLGTVLDRLDAMYRDAGAIVLGAQADLPDTRYCLFGTDERHENPAQLAIRASVTGRSLVKEANAESWRIAGAPLALHAGIHMGTALVQRDPGTQKVTAVEGVSLIVSSRLAQGAPPSAILVDNLTRQAAGSTFFFSGFDQLPFHTSLVSVPSFSLELRAPNRVRTARLSTGRYVRPPIARDSELRQIRDLVANAVATDRLTTAIVQASRESGRSRFIRRAVDGMRASNGDLIVAEAAIAHATRSSHPHALLGQLVKSVTGLHPGESIRSGREQLAQFINSITTGMPLSPNDATWLLHLADVGDVPDVVGHDAALAAEISYRAAAELLRMVTSSRPLLVTIDDIDLAGSAELGIILRLANELAERPAAFLLTSSVPAVDRLGWTTPPDVQLTLGRLTPVAGRVLIDEILGRRNAMPHGEAESIVEHVEGIPQAIEEVVALLMETEVLSSDEVTGTWRLTSGDIPAGLPRTMNELVEARLEQMPRPRVSTIARAAACGDVFWPALIEEMGDPEVGANLVELLNAGLIVTSPEDALEGHVAYRFTHPVMAEAAYRELSELEARKLHERAARWLAVNTGERFNAWLGTIAWHFGRASQFERAVSYHIQAGQWARSRGALSQAAHQFDRAREFSTDSAVSAEISLELGVTYQLLGQGEHARDCLEAALASGVEREDERFELKALIPLSATCNQRGELARGQHVIERGLHLANKMGAVLEIGKLQLQLAQNHLLSLREVEAATAAEQAAEALTQCNESLGILQANIEASRTLLHTGQLMRAEFAYDEARRYAEELNHWLLVTRAQHGEAWLHLLQGRTDKALGMFSACQYQFEPVGAVGQAIGAALGKALCLLDKEQFTEAANTAAGALAQAEFRKLKTLAALCQGAVGYVYGTVELLGQRLKAKNLSSAALRAARKNRQQHLSECVETLSLGGAPRLQRILGLFFRADYLLKRDPQHSAGLADAAEAIALSSTFEDCQLVRRIRKLHP